MPTALNTAASFILLNYDDVEQGVDFGSLAHLYENTTPIWDPCQQMSHAKTAITSHIYRKLEVLKHPDIIGFM
jgi:hypothetical protein